MKPTLEMIAPSYGQSFACLNIDQRHFDSPYHQHPEIEITWIIESEGQRRIGDSIKAFQAGDFAMIGPHLPHQYINWKPDKARSKVIQFLPNLFGEHLFHSSEFKQIEKLLQRSTRGLSFSTQTKDEAIKRMTSLFRTTSPTRKAIQLLDLLDLLSCDEKAMPIASIAYQKSTHHHMTERLEKALQLIDNNWDQPISLSDVAKVINLHTHSVSRFFKQHLGMSFQDYLTQLRISRATQLLLESDRTIADIAYSCGFRNLSNFNRRFKQIKEVSPQFLRNALQAH